MVSEDVIMPDLSLSVLAETYYQMDMGPLGHYGSICLARTQGL